MLTKAALKTSTLNESSSLKPLERLSVSTFLSSLEKVKQWVNEQSFLIFGKNEVPLTKALFLQRAYKIIFLLILSGIAERPLAFYPTLLKINYLFSNLLFFGGVLWMIKVVRDQSYSSSHPCQPLISETYIPQNNIGISPSAQKSLLPVSVIDEKPFLTTPPITEQKPLLPIPVLKEKPLLPAPVAKVVPSTTKKLGNGIKKIKAEILILKDRIETNERKIAMLAAQMERFKQIMLEELSNRQSSKKRPTPSA